MSLVQLADKVAPGVTESAWRDNTQFFHHGSSGQWRRLFTETELARTYNTAEALLSHEAVQAFVRWVKDKPEGFSERTRMSRRLK